MANELIRPIDPDSAHAVEEAAKAFAKAIDAAMQTGRYVGEVLGDLPHDLVGIIGDYVKQKRARRWAELSAEADRILRERGVKDREEVSPSVAIPLIAAAINEDREGLKELWAKLLAAALDPNRAKFVRPAIIELMKQLDPLDAQIIEIRTKAEFGGAGDLSDRIVALLHVERDDAFFSLEHLYELGCLTHRPDQVPVPPLSAKARLLVRAVT